MKDLHLRRTVRLLLVSCVSGLSLVTCAVEAQEPSRPAGNGFFGLLPVRDLTPFGFLRLDMRQSPAAFSASRSPSIEIDLGYQNTWALSDDVRQYLRSRPRGPLTQADIANIRAMPGEHFLVDGEIALLDVAVNYPLTERLGVYAVLSAASYTGGFLDDPIEGFHSAFGIDRAGRPGLTRNQVNLFYDLKGVQYSELDRPDEWGVLDPVLGLRYALVPNPTSLAVELEMAVKIPLNGDEFFSTGSVDVGAQLAAQLIRGRHAFYASGALVYYSGSGTPFHDPATVVPTGIVGYEYRWYPSTHLIAQMYASRSVYGAAMTDLDELRKTKYQVSVGVRQRLERGYWSFAVTENVINFNNSPDIGFQVGLGFEF